MLCIPISFQVSVYTYIGLCKVSKGEWEEGYENLEKAIQANEAEETPSIAWSKFRSSKWHLASPNQ